MKKLKQLLCLGLVTTMFTAPAFAGVNGQIDFDDLTAFYGEPKVEVNLSASLMSMIGSFAKADDPEVGQILSNLESIKVRVYNLNGETEKADSTMESVASELRAENWETLVTVNDNEDNQKVRIFSKSTDDVIDGVVFEHCISLTFSPNMLRNWSSDLTMKAFGYAEGDAQVDYAWGVDATELGCE